MNLKKEDTAMSNNLKKIVAVALFSTFGLAACSKNVQAKPTNYSDDLVAFTDNKDEIYHNLVSIIDDAYRDGNLSSAVLDEVLYQYSVSVFGRYNKVAKPYNLGEGEITLKDAATDLNNGTHEVADKFIDAHKAYWTTDDKGERVTTEEAKVSERARVSAKWKTIEDRIARNFYGDISGGSYSTRGYLSEKKYLAELKSQLKHVKDPYAAGTVMTEDIDKVVVTPDVQEEEVFTEEVDSQRSAGAKTTYLHRENYQDAASYTLGSGESIDTAVATYVEEDIIPTIYRNLLVEQYLLDESYGVISKSFARKVNVLSISTNSNNDKAADYLMKYFVRNKISQKDAEITLDDFKAVSNAVKGVTAESQAYLDLVNTAYPGAFPKISFEGFDGNPYSYYVGTDYGDMMASFQKITMNLNTTDTSAESDFTGSYTYTADVGKEIKENEIKAKDYTTDGWFIQENSVGDLPDSIKTRLFNVGVANVVDNEDTKDRFEGANYAKPEGESKLVAKINGKYYLKVASKQAGAIDEDDILFYESGKYYVVQIEEAVSNSKLAKESEKYASDKKEEIINEVARIKAQGDTYRSLSTKHWLEQASLKYHDSKVYDYFKTNYPDLF